MPKILKFPSRPLIKDSPKKLILKSFLSPGDIVMLTAAVRDLKKAHGDRFLVDVRTSCGQLWENNPHLTPLDENDPEVQVIEAEYPLIHRSNTSPYHFIHGYRMHLEDVLGVQIPATDFKGDIHLSDDEKSWISQIEEMGIKDDFWIINAGGKLDFTAKIINPDKLQEVVDHFKGKIQFVQVGEKDHFHPKLEGVIDLIGKTDIRQLVRLVYHSVGVMSPVSFLMHLAAAVEMKRTPPKTRAAVIYGSNREPVQWEAYPHHFYLHCGSSLSCADRGGCWVSRSFRVGDGDKKDTENLCLNPVEVESVLAKKYYPNIKYIETKCLNMITSKRLIDAVEMCYEGDTLKYNK